MTGSTSTNSGSGNGEKTSTLAAVAAHARPFSSGPHLRQPGFAATIAAGRRSWRIGGGMQVLDRATRNTIASHYSQRGHRLHARWKLANDPVYAATADLLGHSALPLLDIGCGIGLLGQYLHAAGALSHYIGVDHDAHKIEAALAAARHGGFERSMQLHCVDVAALPPISGHVALLDVLHYLPADRQPALLQTATTHLAPDGVLVIRNVLREPNWRFHATRLEEFFLRVSGWIPGGAQHYPTADELRAPLENAGLDVDITSLRGRTPYNSYLMVARPHR